MNKQEKLAKLMQDVEEDLTSYKEQLARRFGKSLALEASEVALKVVVAEASLEAIKNSEDSTLATRVLGQTFHEVVGRHLSLIHVAHYLAKEIGEERTKELVKESYKDSDEFLSMVAHAVEHALKHINRAVKRS